MRFLFQDRLLERATAPETLIQAYRASRRGRRARELATFDAAWPEQMARLARLMQSGALPPSRGRVFQVPKASGGTREIVSQSLEESIVQRALLLALTPRLERSFLSCSYAYRQGRDRMDALLQVERWRREGCTHAFRADISGCFDHLEHGHMKRALRRLVPSRGVLRLLYRWLDTVGRPRLLRTRVGIPQGAVLSPLLANVYLHSVDRALTRRRLRYLRYGDDLLVVTKTEREAARAEGKVRRALGPVHLRFAKEKTWAGPITALRFLGENLPLVDQPFPGEESGALRFSQSSYWLRARTQEGSRTSGAKRR